MFTEGSNTIGERQLDNEKSPEISAKWWQRRVDFPQSERVQTVSRERKLLFFFPFSFSSTPLTRNLTEAPSLTQDTEKSNDMVHVLETPIMNDSSSIHTG